MEVAVVEEEVVVLVVLSFLEGWQKCAIRRNPNRIPSGEDDRISGGKNRRHGFILQIFPPNILSIMF